MQDELRSVIERAQDARAVLGLGSNAPASEARAAFHSLCKRYHPTRFARSSPETVRLANEAFLAIRRAYDEIARPPDRAPAGTGAVPIVPARESRAIPRPVTDSPSASTRIPAAGRPSSSGPRPPSGPDRGHGAPAVPRPQAMPDAAVRETVRMRSIPPGARATLKMTTLDEAPPAEVGAPALTEPERFAQARELLRRRLWDDAERALGELAVSVPSQKTYRAYRDYARGRIAQDAGRLDEARAAWERALRLDPDLGAARAALESLPEPERPAGGIWSRLFKR